MKAEELIKKVREGANPKELIQEGQIYKKGDTVTFRKNFKWSSGGDTFGWKKGDTVNVKSDEGDSLFIDAGTFGNKIDKSYFEGKVKQMLTDVLAHLDPGSQQYKSFQKVVADEKLTSADKKNLKYVLDYLEPSSNQYKFVKSEIDRLS